MAFLSLSFRGTATILLNFDITDWLILQCVSANAMISFATVDCLRGAILAHLL